MRRLSGRPSVYHLHVPRHVFWLLSLLLASWGCGARQELQFSPRQQVLELPERHQQQIADVLLSLYGTPGDPRFLLPTGDLPETELSEEAPAEQAEFDLGTTTTRVPRIRLRRGVEVYQQRCASCHGVTGDGKGVAAEYLNPKPRDYRRGIFKFTSTPYGSKPRRQDLRRTIRRGAKGTSMPAFPWLSDEDVESVIDYVIMLSHRGELEYSLAMVAVDYDADQWIDAEEIFDYSQRTTRAWDSAATRIVLPLTHMPEMNDETVALGKQAFLTKGCSKCHGEDGRGHTQENVGQDAWGNTVHAADLTSGMLHGGRRPIDIYRRIYSGINGTPMPAFSASLAAEPDTFWHLVYYVLHVAEQGGKDSAAEQAGTAVGEKAQ